LTTDTLILILDVSDASRGEGSTEPDETNVVEYPTLHAVKGSTIDPDETYVVDVSDTSLVKGWPMTTK